VHAGLGTIRLARFRLESKSGYSYPIYVYIIYRIHTHRDTNIYLRRSAVHAWLCAIGLARFRLKPKKKICDVGFVIQYLYKHIYIYAYAYIYATHTRRHGYTYAHILCMLGCAPSAWLTSPTTRIKQYIM